MVTMTQQRVSPLRDSAGSTRPSLRTSEPAFEPAERSGVRLRTLRSLEVPSAPVIETREVYLDELVGLDPEMMAVLEAELLPPTDSSPEDPSIESEVVFLDELVGLDPEMMAFLEAECRTPTDDANDWQHLAVKVDYLSDSNFFAGLSMDVAQGGLLVTTYQPSPVGTNVMLSVSLPGGHAVTARGVVRFLLDDNDDFEDALPGMGVAFVDLSDEDLSHIRSFCRTRPPTYYDTD